MVGLTECCALLCSHRQFWSSMLCMVACIPLFSSLSSLLLSVDYTCSSDGEGVNATSGSTVVGGALWCGYLCNVLAIHGDAEVGAADCKSSALVVTFLSMCIPSQLLVPHADCHSSCKSCLRGNDPTACTSCNDNSLQVAGEPAGPCQPPGKNAWSSLCST